MIDEIKDLLPYLRESDYREDTIALLEAIWNFGREPGVNQSDLLRQIGLTIEELQ